MTTVVAAAAAGAAVAARRRVVIVGGVAGGASTAARLRRLCEECDVEVIERGKFVSFANCGLPYYVGNVIPKEGNLIVATTHLFQRRFNIKCQTEHEVVDVDAAARRVRVRCLATRAEFDTPYDALVLATGASAVVPPIPGIDVDADTGKPVTPGVFVLRTIPDGNQIRQWIADHKARSVCVVGAAWAGLEVADALKARGLDVTVLELAPQILPLFDGEMTTPMRLAMQAAGVNVVTGDALASVRQTEPSWHDSDRTS